MTTEEFHRKLTAILSADAQGYSRLMEEDEESTIRTLTAYRMLMSSLIQSHRGHVVDTPGDNLLAEFGSVMDAVRCAVEIQEELRIRNAELPENRRMQFRIGINMGDIIEDGDHIYGDGVNIAARVEGMAEGGGICISGTVYDAIRNKLSMSYEFMGEHVVKNIKELVRIYRIKVEPEAESATGKKKKVGLRAWQWAALSVAAILVLGSVAYIVFNKFYIVQPKHKTAQVPAVSEAVKAKKTIAVLPFEDDSPAKDQEYFVNGLSEEILNTLAKIPDLGVTARTSSFSFKGKSKTVQEIGSVLGVDNILEGSVRKAGNTLRITAQLVRAKDGLHLWSNSYDKELKDVADILSIQEDVATAVANELKVKLEIGKYLIQLGGTENLEAYELYLVAQGQYKEHQMAEASKSIDKALALDPKYALAWAFKSNWHLENLMDLSSDLVTTEYNIAVGAAAKAIELDPNLAEGNVALGHIKMARGKWAEAELAYGKAIELTTELTLESKGALFTHYWSVGNLDKANTLLGKMVKSDPLNPKICAMYIDFLGVIGDIQHAEKEDKRCEELFSDKWNAYNWAITEARINAHNVVSKDNIVYSSPIYDSVKKNLDSPKEGLAELHRFFAHSNKLNVSYFMEISLWAAYFGDSEFALNAIGRGISLQSTSAHLLWHPIMKEVRQLPRFKEYVREIGLVDYWNKFGWPDICRPLDNGDFVCD